jgi:hypothetical protein
MKYIILPIAVTILLLVSGTVAGDDDLKVYFGNLHSHTGYSDGSATPEAAYKHAMRAHLQFMAITEHNHANGIKPKGRDGVPIGVDHKLYNGKDPDSLISTANRFNKDGNRNFVALYGQEFSTIKSGNHTNVFQVGEVITAENGEFDQLVDWLAGHPDSADATPIVQFNHPSTSLRDIEYGRDDFGSDKKWIAAMGKYAKLIEILNGPGLKKDDGHEPTHFEPHFKYYLSLGFHVAPTADQDNHYETWGTLTDARTGIIASALTKARLLEAMRARHVFATEDKNLGAIVRIKYVGMPSDKDFLLCGDIVRKPPPDGTELTITYTLEDKDEPEAEYEIEVYSGQIGGDRPKVIATHKQSGDTAIGHPGTISGIKYSGGRQFFYLKFNQEPDEDTEGGHLWTAPVWFDADAEEE